MFSRFPLICLGKFTTSGHMKLYPTGLLTYRTKTTSIADERVVITDDGSTIVCWHPPKQFPYECSRPIVEEEIKPQNTLLKIENKSQIYNVFKTKTTQATTEELMKLTHTTKHRWAPNNRRYKETYKRIKSDRDWL